MGDQIKKAIIIYHSRKGTTASFAFSIGSHLKTLGYEIRISSITDVNINEIETTQLVLLGCWTKGMFLMFQRPDKKWQNFITKLPNLCNKKLGLFTTYNIRTGSMFKAMKKMLGFNIGNHIPEIKSRNQNLSAANKAILNEWLKNDP